MQREIPILFSAPMVLAILEDRKDRTRRMSRLDAVNVAPDEWRYAGLDADGVHHLFDHRSGASVRVRCPYGVPGDLLWVRETWGLDWSEGYAIDLAVTYRADGEQRFAPKDAYAAFENLRRGQWRPSIHMPRWASRISREVTGVRVERLQDITVNDIQAEGLKVLLDDLDGEDGHVDGDWLSDLLGSDVWRGMSLPPLLAWRRLWESINGEASWNANPWVWVVEFKHTERKAVAA